MINSFTLQGNFGDINPRYKGKLRPKCDICKEPIFNRRANAKYCKPCSIAVRDNMNIIYLKNYHERRKNNGTMERK